MCAALPGSRAVDTPRLPRLHSAFDLLALRMSPHVPPLAPPRLRAHPDSVSGVPPRARVFRPSSRVLCVGSAARWAA